ncbi:MAG: hypothetical protein LC789_10005 [Actinobacteria bacterium]|nr:hypothetical protein [Actinomycetota bacterium]
MVSDDGAKLTVQLRRDARFSDGTAVHADDVAFTRAPRSKPIPTGSRAVRCALAPTGCPSRGIPVRRGSCSSARRRTPRRTSPTPLAARGTPTPSSSTSCHSSWPRPTTIQRRHRVRDRLRRRPPRRRRDPLPGRAAAIRRSPTRRWGGCT